MKNCEKTVCEECVYDKNKLFSDQCDSCYRNMNFKRKESIVARLTREAEKTREVENGIQKIIGKGIEESR